VLALQHLRTPVDIVSMLSELDEIQETTTNPKKTRRKESSKVSEMKAEISAAVAAEPGGLWRDEGAI
jgi:hypothetical protein